MLFKINHNIYMYPICFLLVFCIGYYIFNEYYPRELKEHISFGIFIGVYMIIYYIYNFEKELVYKMFTNINEIHKKPLYDISLFKTNEIVNSMKSYNSASNFKQTILQIQHNRCHKCMNYIVESDLSSLNLQYKIPFGRGGEHTPDNLMILCPSCQKFLT